MYNEGVLNSATIEGMLAAPGIKWHRDPPDVIGMWLADPDFPTAPGSTPSSRPWPLMVP